MRKSTPRAITNKSEVCKSEEKQVTLLTIHLQRHLALREGLWVGNLGQSADWIELTYVQHHFKNPETWGKVPQLI